jgi:hypothetical protein
MGKGQEMDRIDRVIPQLTVAYGVSPDYKASDISIWQSGLESNRPISWGQIKNLFSRLGK